MRLFKLSRPKMLADPEEAARRRAICDACPHRVAAVCGKCACPIISKVNSRGASCPANRW